LTSADGQAFRRRLEDIDRAGIRVYVLGFREHASRGLASDTLESSLPEPRVRAAAIAAAVLAVDVSSVNN
jgi:hypothetical protein